MSRGPRKIKACCTRTMIAKTKMAKYCMGCRRIIKIYKPGKDRITVIDDVAMIPQKVWDSIQKAIK